MELLNLEEILKYNCTKLRVKTFTGSNSGGTDYVSKLYLGKKQIGTRCSHVSWDDRESDDNTAIFKGHVEYFADKVRSMGYEAKPTNKEIMIVRK